MNKHILLVMRWLNNKDSVSQDELEKNSHEAWKAWDVAYAGSSACYGAATRAACNDAANAGYWVDIYFDRTGEDKNEYLKELEK